MTDLGPGLAGWFGRLAYLGLEAAASRFYSNYDADVEDGADPSQQGRSKICVHATGRTEPLDTRPAPTRTSVIPDPVVGS